ncbi:MAG TPA: SLC13 family permease, partial [Kofleriaceae bacterium]|nr:SLC13 family permease [Kofleriaceae bacterium]
MTSVFAIAILSATVGLSLARPRFGRIRVEPPLAAAAGAAATIATGLVPLDLAANTLRLLAPPLLTIACLMAITVVCERAGLLDALAAAIARGARGSGRRLLALIFAAGAVTGTLFTNDAAVLLFTPLVIALVEEVALPGWTLKQRLPYYFAVLNVGNLVGALVISNPINLIVSSVFGIPFLDYAVWMALPALAAALVTFAGLRLAFGASLPERCAEAAPRRRVLHDPWFAAAAAGVLALTLLGFFAERWTGVEVWKVAAAGAVVLVAIHAARGRGVVPIVRGIGWDVIVFAACIFLVAMGLRAAGFAELLGSMVAGLGGDSIGGRALAISGTAAVCSSLLNNHPTASLMIWVIQDMELDSFANRILAFAALIGGDLGPKMLPIGSLAALMWFQIL